MIYKQYKFKFYLDMSHAIRIDGNLGQKHPHTWEIAMNILKIKDTFSEFNNLEKRINGYFSKYQDKYINTVEPFDVVNPTLENCCDVFKDDLSQILNEEGWILIFIEMSETPTRSYVVNLLDNEDTEENQVAETVVDSILEKVRNRT